MICPNCGSENSNDVSQCVHCGQRFAPKDPQPSTNTQTNTDQNTDYYKAGENRTDGSTNQWNGWNQQQTNADNQSWNTRQMNHDNQGWNNQQASPNNQGWNNQQNYQNNPNWYNGQTNWQPRPKDPNHGFALASLIVGVASIFLLCFLPYLSLPLDIVGIVLGIIALKKPGSKGMAIAGICVSAIMLVASIIMLAMVFYIMANFDQFESFYNEFYNYYDMQGLWIQIRNIFF